MKHTFTKPQINADKLSSEIQTALPTSEFQNIEFDNSKIENNLVANFDCNLSQEEITILNTTVNNHVI